MAEMKKIRHGEKQIIGHLLQSDAGMPFKACRKTLRIAHRQLADRR